MAEQNKNGSSGNSNQNQSNKPREYGSGVVYTKDEKPKKNK